MITLTSGPSPLPRPLMLLRAPLGITPAPSRYSRLEPRQQRPSAGPGPAGRRPGAGAAFPNRSRGTTDFPFRILLPFFPA